MAGPPIDKGWAWACVMGANINMIFVIGGYKTSGILFVEMVDKYRSTAAMGAMLMGFITGMMSFIAPIGNAFGARYGYRRVVAVGGAAFVMGYVLTSFANDIVTAVCILGIFQGIGCGCLFSTTVVVVGQYFNKRRSLANGIAMAGGSIGQLIIPLMMRYLVDEYALQGALLVWAGMTSHIFIAAALFRPLSFYSRQTKTLVIVEDCDIEAPSSQVKLLKEEGGRPRAYSESERSKRIFKAVSDVDHKIHSSNKDLPTCDPVVSGSCDNVMKPIGNDGFDLQPVQAAVSIASLCVSPVPLEPQKVETKSSKSWWQSLKSAFMSLGWGLFKNYLFLIYMLGVCFGNCGYVTVFLFLPHYAESLGWSRANAALILSLIGVADLIGRLGGGAMADSLPMKRSNLMALCIFITAATVFICSIVNNIVSFCFLCFEMGLVGGFYIALMGPVLVDFLGLEVLSEAFGMTTLFMGLINMPHPSLLGYIYDVTGSHFIPLMICAAYMFVASLLLASERWVRPLQERKEQREKEAAE